MKLFAAIGLLALTVLATAQQSSKRDRPDMVSRVNRVLKLQSDQIERVDAIVRSHQQKLRAILEDKSLSKVEKAEEFQLKVQSMILELTPFLTPNQIADLNDLFYNILHPGPHAKIAIDFSDVFLLDSRARAIFGNSLRSYGLGFGGDEVAGRRSRIGFTFDFFDLPSGSNKLFVLSPQVSYEHRVPVAKHLYAFGIASAGPAYMDYSYDDLSGNHFGAKRAGLDGSAELGLQWGPVRVGIAYRAFTQPSGLNFNGVEATAAVTVLRF